MKLRSSVLLICGLTFLSSCEKSNYQVKYDHYDDSLEMQTDLHSRLSGITVPASRLPLFADLEAYNLLQKSPRTRSDTTDTLYSLESLIDTTSIEEIEYRGVSFRQIPFYQNSSNQKIWSSFSQTIESGTQNIVGLKKFLIEGTHGDVSETYVITFVPTKSYDMSHPDYDFINRPNYSGAAVFSDVDGTLLGIRSYHNGMIYAARPLTIMTTSDDESYLMLYEEELETRTELGGDITPSICIGITENWIDPSWCIAHMSGNGGGGGFGGHNGGNWSLNPPAQQSLHDIGGILLPNLLIPEIECSIQLTSNIPEVVEMTGTGIYTAGTFVAIDKILKYLVLEEPVFSYFRGGFERQKALPFLHQVSTDVDAVAFFDVNIPCSDDLRGVTNPLMDMRVAASKLSGYIGGTFGMVRTYGTQKHSGIDFYAEEGTPVYAMYSGEIKRVVGSHSLTTGYVDGSYGNRIIIESQMPVDEFGDIRTLSVMYAHLYGGGPIATNPRTGVPFKVGDRVYRGDLIGYTGRTGNAFKVNYTPNPHLHLGMSFDGDNGIIPKSSWIDPSPYINGTLNTDSLTVNNGRITNIKCD